MPVTIGGSGPITGVTSINTTVSDTELGYLDGLTEPLTTSLAGKADTTGNGAWTSWTPAISGTGWAIGNGTRTGRWAKIGRIAFVVGRISFGSTTTYGTGALTISLPANLQTGEYPGQFSGLRCTYYDASTGYTYSTGSGFWTGTNGQFYPVFMNSGGALRMATVTTSNNIPVAPGSGDDLSFYWIYETES